MARDFCIFLFLPINLKTEVFILGSTVRFSQKKGIVRERADCLYMLMTIAQDPTTPAPQLSDIRLSTYPLLSKLAQYQLLPQLILSW
jgi:hypothetical protein